MAIFDKFEAELESVDITDKIRSQVRDLLFSKHASETSPEAQIDIGDLQSQIGVAIYLMEYCTDFDPIRLETVFNLLSGVQVFNVNHLDLIKAMIGEEDMSSFLTNHQGTDFLNPNSPQLKKVLLHYWHQYVAKLAEQFSSTATTVLFPQDAQVEGQRALSGIFKPDVAIESFDFSSGYFGNVVIGKHADYVLKISKRDPTIKVHQPQHTLPALNENGGQEFIPKQFLIQSQGGNTAVLQKKIDLESMKCVNVYVPQTELTEFLREAMQNDSNRAKLRRFIKWFKATVDQYDMMPDLVGENLFMSITGDGELDIKFVDTKECWDLGPQRDAHNDAQIVKMTSLINSLEELS